MSNTTKFAAAALAGLLTAGMMAPVAAHAESQAKKEATGSMSVEKHACKGMNSCKGKGGCKGADNACKGHNSCKAKGNCATDGSKKTK